MKNIPAGWECTESSDYPIAAISFAHVTLTISGEPLPVIDGLTRELSNAVHSGAISLRRAREVSPLTATVDDRYEVTLVRGARTSSGTFCRAWVWDMVECEYVAETRETCYNGYCVHEIMKLELSKLFPGKLIQPLECECECERKVI